LAEAAAPSDSVFGRRLQTYLLTFYLLFRKPPLRHRITQISYFWRYLAMAKNPLKLLNPDPDPDRYQNRFVARETTSTFKKFHNNSSQIIEIHKTVSSLSEW